MHRLGAILMILGANIAVGSRVAAFWRASYVCASKADGGTCAEGAFRVFLQLLASAEGIVFWIVVMIGLLVFWRGKRIRGR